MRETITGWTFQLLYLFTHLTPANIVDILLVAVVFFVVLQVLHQTRSLQLLRGMLIFAVLGTTLPALLPLNTFNWLLRAVLLAAVVAWPILFQDALRQVLTGLGQMGRLRRGRGSAYDRFKTVLIKAVTQLAAHHTGALIVMEAETPLAEIVATGIPVQAEALSTELLVGLFHPQNPLHDGAVVLRGDRLVAASCILPVQTEGSGETHLGTRHRAAWGLSSQVADALVIVVSEETGRISVAQAGHLHQGLSESQLGGWLDRFQNQLAGQSRSRWQWLRRGGSRAMLQNLAMAVGLALIAWLSVIYQTNPPQQVTIRAVPLKITAPASGLVLTNDLPETISVQVQATQDHLAAVDADSIRAELALGNLPTGVNRVPVAVTLADSRAQVVSLTPEFCDVTLELLATRTLSPTVTILDVDTLPLGYTVDEPRLSPKTITLRGPQSLVEQVTSVKTSLTLDEHRADFQKTLPLELLDEAGQPVTGLQPSPETILVTVPIRRTFYSREIAVQPTLAINSLDPGYEVTRVRVTPPAVTIIGMPNALEAAGDSLATAPISLTHIHSGITLDVPLILPEGVSALDAEKKPVTSVVAQVTVVPVTDYLVLTLSPVLSNLAPSLAVQQLQPAEIKILLTGPQPLVTEVQDTLGLVTIGLDMTGYYSGTHVVPLDVQSPQDLQVELFPPEVQIALVER